MEEKGIVTKASKLKATVQLKRHSFCGACNVCKKNDDGTAVMEVENSKNANVGDKVIISVKNKPSKVLILMILLPILSSLILGGLTYLIFNNLFVCIVLGLVGLIASLYFVLHLKREIGLKRRSASIQKIYEKGDQNGRVNNK